MQARQDKDEYLKQVYANEVPFRECAQRLFSSDLPKDRDIRTLANELYDGLPNKDMRISLFRKDGEKFRIDYVVSIGYRRTSEGSKLFETPVQAEYLPERKQLIVTDRGVAKKAYERGVR